MSVRIDEHFLAEFFGIEETKEGKAELLSMRSRLKRMVFKNNQDICTIDGDPDGMFFIESGTAIVLDRDEKQLNILHVGQYFGEYAVLSGQKRLSTVRSLGKSVIYKMESSDLLEFLGKHPGIYGDFMKRVYAQLSNKHSQIMALSGMRRGILSHPGNKRPLSGKQVILQYGSLVCLYLAAIFLIPGHTGLPLFLLPLIFMLIYVLITKRTRESLIASSILAAAVIYKKDIFAGLADSLMDTLSSSDNAFTILVMALMGGMVNLIIRSGGVTAFEKAAEKHCKTSRGLFLSSLAIMAVTSIDDGLNMLTASYATYNPAKRLGIVREKLALFYSMLPTVLSSFIPISLWGIFVTGTLSAATGENATELFLYSIPFNFFSAITLLAMILFSLGLLPLCRQIKDAEKRYKETGSLWPAGSEKYLSVHETEVWGKISNVIFPILVMAISSLVIRTRINEGFAADSSIGLIVALIFMFILYCFRGIFTPEQFIGHLTDGISESALPIILYILTINFSSLLNTLGLQEYIAGMIGVFRSAAFLMPSAVFLLSMLLTVALGSSWSMYALTFPVVLGIASSLGLSPALMAGAVASGGLAGEKNCAFTADALNVGTAAGINPDAVRQVRVFYSTIFTMIAAAGYLIAGIVM